MRSTSAGASSTSTEKLEVDLLIHPIGRMVTGEAENGPLKGKALSTSIQTVDAAIAIKGEKIIAAGPAEEILARIDNATSFSIIDAAEKLVSPGLVDPHTHLVFGGNRADEFALRCQGKTYAEIAAAGGGIKASMLGTTNATREELIETGKKRLSLMLDHGTTTCEIKTGYGSTKEAELRMLEAILDLRECQPVDIVPTFMPAHAIPNGRHKDEYVEEVIAEMLPAARKILDDRGLPADTLFVDVFCDEGYFTVADTKAIFEKALALGMRLRVHSDEFKSLGATTLACEMGAYTADHLLVVREEEMDKLAVSDTIATLLPGTSFFLNLDEHAPARELIDRGAAIAIGSDYNPGSCHIFSMPFILGLSCLHLKLTAGEALNAATINSAYAIGRGDAVGQLRTGYQADIVLWDVSRLEEIPYNIGRNPIAACIKRGRLCNSQ